MGGDSPPACAGMGAAPGGAPYPGLGSGEGGRLEPGPGREAPPPHPHTPPEYYEFRLESGDRDDRPQSSGKNADRAGKQDQRSRGGKHREAEDDRGR